MLNDDIRHKIFRIIEENPEINQRMLADMLGISLGKTNYCIQALIEKGWLKVNNFKNSNNKFDLEFFETKNKNLNIQNLKKNEKSGSKSRNKTVERHIVDL